eukprot:scaffold22457_cov47-Attheya_sp.AAC.2
MEDASAPGGVGTGTVVREENKESQRQTDVVVAQCLDQVIAKLGENSYHLAGRKRPLDDGGTHTYGAPTGLEIEYETLRGILRRCLVDSHRDDTTPGSFPNKNNTSNDNNTSSTSSAVTSIPAGPQQTHNHQNASALLMGPRGHGKTLVLERCLRSLQEEQRSLGRSHHFFRIVRIHGVLTRGDDVGAVVADIVRQLSDNAWKYGVKAMQKQTKQKGTVIDEDARRRALELDRELLRIRKSAFTSNLALLDEVLGMACIDSTPVLIILDELDAFISTGQSSGTSSTSSAKTGGGGSKKLVATSDRQLLLYHLLDRVADHSSSISLIGITTRLGIVGKFEKRVKSRAEGTSKTIYFGHSTSYESMVEILLSKFDDLNTATTTTTAAEEEQNETPQSAVDVLSRSFRSQLSDILLPAPRTSSFHTTSEDDSNMSIPIREIFEYNYKLGKDARWFCGVLSGALTNFLEDYLYGHYTTSIPSSHDVKGIRLTENYLFDGLMAMGASVPQESETLMNTSTKQLSRESRFRIDPRLQTLLDLSGSDMAVIMCVKRILSRDGQDDLSRDAGREEEKMKPLTLERIEGEYATFRGTRYTKDVFFRSFVNLMEVDLLRPSNDHMSGGALQYKYNQIFHSRDETSMKRVPLHFTLDLERELGEAFKRNLLDCPTELREWGKKMN